MFRASFYGLNPHIKQYPKPLFFPPHPLRKLDVHLSLFCTQLFQNGGHLAFSRFLRCDIYRALYFFDVALGVQVENEVERMTMSGSVATWLALAATEGLSVRALRGEIQEKEPKERCVCAKCGNDHLLRV